MTISLSRPPAGCESAPAGGSCWFRKTISLSLTMQAEVARLAGATAEAEICLRTALDLHQQRRATVLADRTRAALARLTGHPR
jgi:hypothetical protein